MVMCNSGLPYPNVSLLIRTFFSENATYFMNLFVILTNNFNSHVDSTVLVNISITLLFIHVGDIMEAYENMFTSKNEQR